jgi:hypothetical protein
MPGKVVAVITAKETAMDYRNRRPRFPSKKVRIGRVRALTRFAARVEHALFVATLAGMAYIYLGPLLAQAI